MTPRTSDFLRVEETPHSGSDTLLPSLFATHRTLSPGATVVFAGSDSRTEYQTAANETKGRGLSLAEVLSSLSRALDLTEGQPMGHAVKACLIALKIADALHLTETQKADLHLAMLLKDAGCSSNSAKMFAIFGGDDVAAKSDAKISDWCRLSEAIKFAFVHTLPDASPLARLQKLREMLKFPGRVMDALTEARCTRGADIARSLSLSQDTIDAIFHLDEHWDGQGAAYGIKGEEIPLLGRIACLAQTLEVFATTYAPAHALHVAQQRSGRWFDPALVRAAESFADDTRFWSGLQTNPRGRLAHITNERLRGRMSEATIDAVCDAFAGIIDAKSSFTGEHSSRVAHVADQIAETLGLAHERRVTLRRAALLHDIGKLSVPNQILDKPGRLTDAEFAVIRRHPFYTEQVLMSIPAWGRLTEIAAAHHEKLDGTGYFRGLSAPDLDDEMRILATADVYDALIAHRPYRSALPPDEVKAIMHGMRGTHLDGECVAALPFS